MAVKEATVLTDDDLSDTDQEVLAVLDDGRVTAQYLADQLGISRQYASDRLTRFHEHDIVERVAPALYELVPANDPR